MSASSGSVATNGTEPAPLPSLEPQPLPLPGTSVGSSLINGLLFYTEVLCILGVLAFAIVWIVGAVSGWKTVKRVGLWGFVVSISMAILVGIASFFVNYFYSVG